MTDEKNKDIFLRHKFTDRGGAEVYDAFAADDRLGMENKLFEIRLGLKTHFETAEVKGSPPGAAKVSGHGTG